MKEQENKRIVVNMLGEIPEVDLPQGWIGLSHKTGGIVYMHKDTRVVTWSRPYQISKFASLRKHDPPIISFPCLHQLQVMFPEKLIQEEEMSFKRKKKQEVTESSKKRQKAETGVTHSVSTNQKIACPFSKNTSIEKNGNSGRENENHKSIQDAVSDKNFIHMPPEEESTNAVGIKNETIDYNALPGFVTVDYDVLHNYIKRIFDFKIDNNWKSPLFSHENFKKSQMLLEEKKKSVISVENKTPLQILHEYSQNILKQKFTIKKMEIENLVSFCVEIVLGDLGYGIAHADISKKAKQDAAAITLNILDPKILPDEYHTEIDRLAKEFDDVDIEDGEVMKMISKTRKDVEKPYQILVRLMKRNFEDFKEKDLEYWNDVKDSSYILMQCNKRNNLQVKVSVSEENKDFGKELAAQAMIKKLYPDLQCWGSIIRLSKQKRPVVVEKETGSSKPTNKFMLALKDEMRKIGGLN